jgi:hypothetical protein
MIKIICKSALLKTAGRGLFIVKAAILAKAVDQNVTYTSGTQKNQRHTFPVTKNRKTL